MSEITPEDLRSLLAENATLAEKLEAAEAQAAPTLSPDEVSALVDRLFAELRSQLSGMAVRDGELHLKVGFGKVGEQQGFVVPTADSPPELRENLHTISIRFTREPD